jgi:hypothetical protein
MSILPEKSRLTITVSLTQGAYMDICENDDGSTRFLVRAGQGNRMRYGGDHPAKFTDMLAVLNGEEVDSASETRHVLGIHDKFDRSGEGLYAKNIYTRDKTE